MNTPHTKNNEPQKVILIAEDDDITTRYYSTALLKTNTRVVVQKNGSDVLNYMKSGKRVDLILMDIFMPELNGIEATREIRTFNKEVIIIMQSAYLLAGQKEKSFEAGCNAFLLKPIRLNDFMKTINKYL